MSSYISQLSCRTSYRKLVEAMAKTSNNNDDINDDTNLDGDDIIVDNSRNISDLHNTTNTPTKTTRITTSSSEEEQENERRPNPDDSYSDYDCNENGGNCNEDNDDNEVDDYNDDINNLKNIIENNDNDDDDDDDDIQVYKKKNNNPILNDKNKPTPTTVSSKLNTISSAVRRETLMSYLSKLEHESDKIPNSTEEKLYEDLITRGMDKCTIASSRKQYKVMKQPMPDDSFDGLTDDPDHILHDIVSSTSLSPPPPHHLNLLDYTSSSSIRTSRSTTATIANSLSTKQTPREQEDDEDRLLEASAKDDILLTKTCSPQQENEDDFDSILKDTSPSSFHMDDDDDDDNDNSPNPLRYLDCISSSGSLEDAVVNKTTPPQVIHNIRNEDDDDDLLPLCSRRNCHPKILLTSPKQQQQEPSVRVFSSTEEDEEEDSAEEDILLPTIKPNAINGYDPSAPLYNLLTQLYTHLCQPKTIPLNPVAWKEDHPGYETFHFQSNEITFIESQFPLFASSFKKTHVDLDDLQALEEEDEQEEEDYDHILQSPPPVVIEPSPKKDKKVGQLQQFYLPIIYHTNQTGFEPTKDLTLETGDVIAAQYYVESTLGTAAFSTAYQCIDLYKSVIQDHHKVCLKVIKNSKDFFDQSLDEIKILSMLTSPNEDMEKETTKKNYLVQMIRYFYHREHLFIVTELLQQNLFDFSKYVDDNTYFQSLKRLKYIGYQLLLGVERIHSLDIIHSDIKPENILLDDIQSSTIKIIDFGSSCFTSDRQSSYIQSRSYRAPEVILGLPYDGKIDIWSLGCVLAEMYTNIVTFTNHSIPTMLARMEAISGCPFSNQMIRESVHGDKYFLQSGLIYQKVVDAEEDLDVEIDEEDYDEKNLPSSTSKQQDYYYEIYKPNVTTMAHTLGFDLNFYEEHLRTTHKNKNYYFHKLSDTNNDTNNEILEENDDVFLFIDFINFLLQKDPNNRPNATQALKHPWMISSKFLNLDDVEYHIDVDDEYEDEDEDDCTTGTSSGNSASESNSGENSNNGSDCFSTEEEE